MRLSERHACKRSTPRSMHCKTDPCTKWGMPEFRWVPPSRLAFERDLLLAELRYDHHNAAFSLNSSFTAPRARRFARPYIRSGSTIPRYTPWQLWIEELERARSVRRVIFGVQAKIDTSPAGFTDLPHYFASVSSWAFPFHSLGEASKNGFTFRLFVPGLDLIFHLQRSVLSRRQRTSDLEPLVLSAARELLPAVSWVGIQPGPTVL